VAVGLQEDRVTTPLPQFLECLLLPKFVSAEHQRYFGHLDTTPDLYDKVFVNRKSDHAIKLSKGMHPLAQAVSPAVVKRAWGAEEREAR
jgi:hypothetical protein